ncbi:MAG: DUF3883 domain-containing protein [Thermodesulfobacteriota bacterium]|nr:DUF3883 domain-containing protein [Thermodesulfobacteriota bacterium]
MKSSDSLELGWIYTRKDLMSKFGINDATLKTGVFRPKGYRSIWLFITENKTNDRTQYSDLLNGDDLYWDGQLQGRTNPMIIGHEKAGDELLVFYRKKKYQYEGAGFRYEGTFRYVSHTGDKPAHFHLRRIDKAERIVMELEIAGAAEMASARRKGQGFIASPEVRRQIEDYAMKTAIEFFRNKGYRVEDSHLTQPYDLKAVKGLETWHIEVKGTSGCGEEVVLTFNEVHFAREHKDSMILFVVGDVEVLPKEPIQVRGGNVRLLQPWDIEKGTLKPVSYFYGLPGTYSN